jgi:hypothetical protein
MQQEQILAMVRHGLTFGGGVLVAQGLVDEGMAAELTGAAMTLVGIVWSIVEKLNRKG